MIKYKKHLRTYTVGCSNAKRGGFFHLLKHYFVTMGHFRRLTLMVFKSIISNCIHCIPMIMGESGRFCCTCNCRPLDVIAVHDAVDDLWCLAFLVFEGAGPCISSEEDSLPKSR